MSEGGKNIQKVSEKVISANQIASTSFGITAIASCDVLKLCKV